MAEPVYWLVAVCLTGKEIAVRSWGLERGFGVYVPMGAWIVRTGARRRPITVARPVFTGYAFVQHDNGVDEFIDDPSSGVFAWLRFVRDETHGPVLAPQEMIDELRARERAGEFNGRGASRPEFEVGQTVGVLIGGRMVRGVLARRLKSGRVRLTGGETWAPIEVDEGELRAVSCG